MSNDLQASTQQADKSVGLPNAGDGKSPSKSTADTTRNRGAFQAGRASKLKLLARLHGAGSVTWAASGVPVTYAMDVFGGGPSRTASGFLDGDFAAPYARCGDEEDGSTPIAARLQLENGREVAVQLVFAASDLAEFEARLTPAEGDLLLAP